MSTDLRSAALRTLAHALCALALVLTASPAARAQETAPMPAPSLTQVPPQPAPETNDEDPCAPEETPVEAGSWIGAGFAAGILNLPKLGIGLELVGELRIPNMWPIELSATYWLENNAELSESERDLLASPFISVLYPAGGSRLQMSALQASAALCPYELDLATGSLLACGGASVGMMRAASEGFVHMSDATRALFELDAYARWHFRLGAGVGISYSAGLFVPFIRDRFGYHDRYGDFHQEFRVAPLGGRLDLAVTYGF